MPTHCSQGGGHRGSRTGHAPAELLPARAPPLHEEKPVPGNQEQSQASVQAAGTGQGPCSRHRAVAGSRHRAVAGQPAQGSARQLKCVPDEEIKDTVAGKVQMATWLHVNEPLIALRKQYSCKWPHPGAAQMRPSAPRGHSFLSSPRGAAPPPPAARPLSPLCPTLPRRHRPLRPAFHTGVPSSGPLWPHRSSSSSAIAHSGRGPAARPPQSRTERL